MLEEAKSSKPARSKAEFAHISEVADRAQLRSIENKRARGWKLLPEDEQFLKEYEVRNAERTQENDRLAKVRESIRTEAWAVKQEIQRLKDKPKVEALVAEYIRARVAVAAYGDGTSHPEEWEKAEEMAKDLNKTRADDAWDIAYGHKTLEEVYPPEEVARTQQLMEDVQKLGRSTENLDWDVNDSLFT